MAPLPLLLSALAAALSMSAQPASPQDPDPGNVRAPDPGETALERVYGLSQSDAVDQGRLTSLLETESQGLADAFGDHFLASIVDYGPNFTITLVFDRQVDISAVQKAVGPDLRRHVRVKRSRLTYEAILETQSQILDALSSRADSVFAGYDYRTDRFSVGVPDGTSIGELRQLFDQSLQQYLDFEIKNVSLLAADTPRGYSGNSVVWGGWPLHDAYGRAVCTAGFILYDLSSPYRSVSTAGHCDESLRTRYDFTDSSMRVLNAPYLDKEGQYSYGKTYDYQLHELRALSASGYVWADGSVDDSYRDNCTLQGTNCQTQYWANVHPLVPVDGAHLRVVGAIKAASSGGTNPYHPIGAIRCKHGFRTGVSCGPITTSSGSFTVKDGTRHYGIVEVEPTDYMVAAFEGDSGGPVFTDPYWDGSGYYAINAAGTVIGGKVENDGTQLGTRPCVIGRDANCNLLYMPIDRINDHRTSLTIKTHNAYTVLN